MTKKSHSAFSFANGSRLRNPVVMAPMTTWSGTNDGRLTADELAYYRARSKDVGMVITATTHIMPNGQGFSGQFYAGDDACIPQLRELASAIQSGGAKAILQIFHAGRSTFNELVEDVVSASAVPETFMYHTTPRALTEDEIATIIDEFANTTRRAIEAGFDGVELHGANGYLMQQFLSPATNQREDQWGGTVENRSRFPLAVVDAVCSVVAEMNRPEFIVGYRLTPEEVPQLNPGLTLEQASYFVDKLANKNISYLHISLQHHQQSSRRDEADLTPVVKRIQDVLEHRIPLIGVGDVHSENDLNVALESGYDLIAVGRALLTEPRWLQLIMDNQPVRASLTEDECMARNIPKAMADSVMSMFKDVILPA